MTSPVTAAATSAYTDPTWNSTTNTSTVNAASTASTSSTDNSTLSSQAFLKLLVAQLQYQDPSQPMDTASFMQETATLTQVQSTTAATATNNSMLESMNAQQASGLVGKNITYTNAAGGISSGLVTSANISTGTPTLRIGSGSDVINLTSVQEVVSTAASSS
jgi:flagellar basal-body rod modification protein FlgD